MLDYQIIAVSRYDGTTKTQQAVEVFNTMTGTTISITRRGPYEAKQAWIDRAFAAAKQSLVTA